MTYRKLLILRMPIGFSLAVVGFLGFPMLSTGTAGFSMLAMVVYLILLMVFPQIALYLPATMTTS